jgi:hypothetical protein
LPAQAVDSTVVLSIDYLARPYVLHIRRPVVAVAMGIRGLTKVAQGVRAVTVQDSTIFEERRLETSLCTGEGERLGLYAIIAERGPVTVFDLALEARIPMSLVLRWLASQTQSGFVVRDVVTGRYRNWCVLPEADDGSG